MSDPLTPRLSTEKAFYLLIFILALAVRLFRLGAAPLNDAEARWALQAWDLIQGSHPTIGAQPAYVLLTAGLFYVWGSTHAIARLIPAIAGSLLVFLPWLLQRYTHTSPRLRIAGLLLAVFLALDPGLVLASRTVGSPILAISFSLLATGLVSDGKSRLAGVCAALALLSGADLLVGLFGLGLSVLAARLLNRAGWLDLTVLRTETEGTPRRFSWQQMLFFGTGTFLVVGTALLLVPQGMGAFADTLPAYLRGWSTPTNMPILQMLVALLTYPFLGVLFGLLGVIRAWTQAEDAHPANGWGRFFSLWAALALFSVIIYPGHQVSMLTWVLIPLWGLASLELAKLFHREEALHFSAGLGVAGLIALLLVLIAHNLLRLLSLNATAGMFAAVIGGIFLMGAIVVVLATMGWNLRTAMWGLSCGTASVLLVLLFSFTWKAAFLNPNGATELWNTGQAAGQMDELADTIADLSWSSKGQPYAIDLVVLLDAPSLRWNLRLFDDARYSPVLPSQETPSIIITPQGQESLTLAASYRGQELVLRAAPDLYPLTAANFLRWAAFRQLTTRSEKLILWVREDLFPSSAADNPLENSQP